MKTTQSRIGKILLIVGILFLIIPFLGFVLNLYFWYGFMGYRYMAVLFIGWFLIILRVSSISLRVSAWTFLLLGLYFYTLVRIYDYEAVTIAYLFYMIPFHILLGLILGIISFQKSKNTRLK